MDQTKQDEKYLYGFSLIPEIGPARFERLKKRFGRFEAAWQAPPAALAKAKISEKTAQTIARKRAALDIDREFEKFKQGDIVMLQKSHPDYPESLRETASAPFVLFCLGDTGLLRKKQLAIVGTRNPSEYGRIATEKLAGEISNAGMVVTSGMAKGIDSCAHQAAINKDRPTVAVLGEGIASKMRNSMSKKIISDIVSRDGVIVSEYQPHFEANKFTFPARNRIISGLSLGVLVVEAGEKSGSLITARYALEQNREVFAVPGKIFSPQSVGTHWLLKQGAQLVRESQDILEAFHFATPQEKSVQKRNFDDEIQQKIYDKLSFEPTHIDKLARSCQLNSSSAATTLSLLELQGAVKNLGGDMFIRQ